MSRLAMISATLMIVSPLAAQHVLPVGSRASAVADAATPARFTFDAPGAGVLTVVVSGADDASLQISDQDGQPLGDGSADIDHGGNLGLEHVTAVITEAGEYTLTVTLLSDTNGGDFMIQAAFVAEAAYETTSDPDRRPSLASSIAVGASHDDQIAPGAGDRVDWFTLVATETTSLVFVTRVSDGNEGDLVIEGYLAGDFSTAVARSDQDLQGVMGNESLTLNVNPGDVVHLKVQSLFDSGDPIPYRLSIGSMP